MASFHPEAPTSCIPLSSTGFIRRGRASWSLSLSRRYHAGIHDFSSRCRGRPTGLDSGELQSFWGCSALEESCRCWSWTNLGHEAVPSARMGWDGSSFKFLVHVRFFPFHFFLSYYLLYTTDLAFPINFLAAFGITRGKGVMSSNFSKSGCLIMGRPITVLTRKRYRILDQFQWNCSILQQNRSRSTSTQEICCSGRVANKRQLMSSPRIGYNVNNTLLDFGVGAFIETINTRWREVGSSKNLACTKGWRGATVRNLTWTARDLEKIGRSHSMVPGIASRTWERFQVIW